MKTIITSNTKTKTQQLYARFVSQSYRHKHRLSFFRLRKRINFLIPRFLLSFSLCFKTLAATKANKKRRKRTYDSLMKVSWLAIELCLITCLYVTKHHLFTQNSNLISRSINITRSLHVKRPTLNIITWLPGPTIKSPPDLLKHNLALSWSRVLHLIKFTLFTTQANHSIILEFAHLKFQRLPPLYIKKASLNFIFTSKRSWKQNLFAEHNH